jgi:hypothetical protein
MAASVLRSMLRPLLREDLLQPVRDDLLRAGQGLQAGLLRAGVLPRAGMLPAEALLPPGLLWAGRLLRSGFVLRRRNASAAGAGAEIARRTA